MDMLRDPYDVRSLRSVAQSGATRASGSLSTLLGRPIGVSLSRAALLAGNADVELGDDVALLGRLSIEGPPHGAAFVAFPEASVRGLCAAFGLAADARAADASSMLGEVANIVTGSLLTELGDTWERDLTPTPVELVLDRSSHDLEARVTGDLEHAVQLECAFADGSGHYDISVMILFARDRRAAVERPSEVRLHG